MTPLPQSTIYYSVLLCITGCLFMFFTFSSISLCFLNLSISASRSTSSNFLDLLLLRRWSIESSLLLEEYERDLRLELLKVKIFQCLEPEKGHENLRIFNLPWIFPIISSWFVFFTFVLTSRRFTTWSWSTHCVFFCV